MSAAACLAREYRSCALGAEVRCGAIAADAASTPITSIGKLLGGVLPRLDRWVIPIVAFRLGRHSDKGPTQRRSGPRVSDGGRYPDDPSHDERPAGYDSN